MLCHRLPTRENATIVFVLLDQRRRHWKNVTCLLERLLCAFTSLVGLLLNCFYCASGFCSVLYIYDCFTTSAHSTPFSSRRWLQLWSSPYKAVYWVFTQLTSSISIYIWTCTIITWFSHLSCSTEPPSLPRELRSTAEHYNLLTYVRTYQQSISATTRKIITPGETDFHRYQSITWLSTLSLSTKTGVLSILVWHVSHSDAARTHTRTLVLLLEHFSKW